MVSRSCKNVNMESNTCIVDEVSDFVSGTLYTYTRARNKSWLLAKNFSICGQFSCTFTMGQQSVTYKISYLQKKANQFLILISSTVYMYTDRQTMQLCTCIHLHVTYSITQRCHFCSFLIDQVFVSS